MGAAQSRLAFACEQPTDAEVSPIPTLAQAFPCPTPAPNEQEDKIWIVDRLLEPQTMPHFLEFCVSAMLPNGKKSSLPSLTIEEIQFMVTPYKEWAPSRYHRLGTAADKVSEVIGSFEDSSRLVVVEQPIHHMKSRIWEGIDPISEKRWGMLNLNSQERHREACEHLASVVRFFDYLNHPQNQGFLRESFDKITEHLITFGNALNELRSTRGENTISMKDLWTEYMHAQCDMMTARAHAWVLNNASTLRQSLLDDLVQSSSELDVSHRSKQLIYKIADLTELIARADYTILFSILADSQAEGLHSHQLEPRRKAYLEAQAMDHSAKLFQDMMVDTTNYTHSLDNWVSICNKMAQTQDELRTKLRSHPEPVPMAPWIYRLLRHRKMAIDEKRTPDANGFVIYRLTYDQSEEQWASFMQKLEVDLAKWTECLSGPTKVDNFFQVRWLNGKALGIPEGDIDGAKKHFQETRNSYPLSKDMLEDCFLVIDAHSVDSYLSAKDISEHPEDESGFVLAVDAEFDPNEHDDHEEESPGYSGVLRIMGGLIWYDLFAMLSAQTQSPRELWPLAMDHPNQVYIGPTTQSQVNRWRAC